MTSQDDLLKAGWTITAHEPLPDNPNADLIIRITAPSGQYADVGFALKEEATR